MRTQHYYSGQQWAKAGTTGYRYGLTGDGAVRVHLSRPGMLKTSA